MSSAQLWGAVAALAVTFIGSVLFQSKRIDDLKSDLIARVDGSEKRLGEKIDGVRNELKADITGLDKRLDLTNKHIDHLRGEVIGRLDRLEDPVTQA